jgi:hypothetical protein
MVMNEVREAEIFSTKFLKSLGGRSENLRMAGTKKAEKKMSNEK